MFLFHLKEVVRVIFSNALLRVRRGGKRKQGKKVSENHFNDTNRPATL